jgi:hypothetical protein
VANTVFSTDVSIGLGVGAAPPVSTHGFSRLLESGHFTDRRPKGVATFPSTLDHETDAGEELPRGSGIAAKSVIPSLETVRAGEMERCRDGETCEHEQLIESIDSTLDEVARVTVESLQ